MVNNCLSRVLYHCFPGHCLLCGQPSGRALDCCPACARELPAIDHPCPRCALPLAGEAPVCGQCLRAPPAYSRTLCPWLYAAPISQLIARIKYRRQLVPARMLAQLFCERESERLLSDPPDALVPVPLHWRRHWQRGYNQAGVIAELLGGALALPVLPRLLRRRRYNPAQQSLSAAQRRRNLHGSFVVRRALAPGLRLALVDDVVTTGSTAGEISRVLLAAGAADVQVWALARTPKS